MKPPRPALPLPRYVIRRWSERSGAWIHLWNLPGWARKGGCPVRNEQLGTNYDDAVKRTETVLLRAYDAWRTARRLGEIKPSALPGGVVRPRGRKDPNAV